MMEADSPEPKKRRVRTRLLASACGICGEYFKPEVKHYHRLTDLQVAAQIRHRHPEWEPAEEACPPCVDAALAPRKPLRSYLRLPSFIRLARA